MYHIFCIHSSVEGHLGQEGIYQHFAAIAKASPVPVVLYNVPGRTGVNMAAETTLRLAREFDNVVAIKEASGNISQMDEIINPTTRRPATPSGPTSSTTLPGL